MGDDDCKALRDQLVDRLSNAGRLCTEQVADAFRTVPRHLFLPGVEPGKSYADEAIPTKWQPDGRAISSSSQPAVTAVMLEQLCVEAGQRVLEIGAGTGYNAALLSHLVGEAGAVTTVDIDEDLVEQASRHLAAVGLARVKVVCADGADGWAESAPYDRIILTVGGSSVSSWLTSTPTTNSRHSGPASGGSTSLPMPRAAARDASPSRLSQTRRGDEVCSASPSYGSVESGPEGFYLRLGFVPTGQLFGETVGALDL